MKESLDTLEQNAEAGNLDQRFETVCRYAEFFENPNESIYGKIRFFNQLNVLYQKITSIHWSSPASIGSIVYFGVNVLGRLRELYKLDLLLEECALILSYENYFNDSIDKLEIEELIKSFKIFLKYWQAFNKSVLSESILNRLSAKIDSSKDKFSWYLKILLDPDFDSYKDRSKLLNHFLHMMFLNYRNMISPPDPNQKVVEIDKLVSTKSISANYYTELKDSLIKIEYSEPLTKLEKFCYDFSVLLRLNQLKTLIKLKKIEYQIIKENRFFTIYINYFGKTLFQYINDLKCRLEEGRALFIIKQILIKTLYLIKKQVFIDHINPFNVFVSENSISVLPQLYFAKKFEYCENEETIIKFTDNAKNQNIQLRLAYCIGMVFVYLISGNINDDLDLGLVKEEISEETLEWLSGLIGPGHNLNLQDALNFLDD